ncbi:MAG: isoprenoid biosynthesis glyoxalase ElbB [Bacteroidales bacterium]|nr:isoprenoid biosynthesis glyoxalase ElbB [Bacteroidales bacterium]
MNKKFAVIIGGCGHRDGSEIHETTMTMLAIEEHGAAYNMFAPDRNQYHVLNHLTGETMNEQRNLLVEAARIARGNIRPLEEFDINNYDAVIFPGGFGVAKNFFTYALDGVNCKVYPDIQKVILQTYEAGKPLGALCISPVLLTKVLGDITTTIGNDENTAQHITTMGGHNINTAIGEVIIDKQHKIYSTPCYMLPTDIKGIHECAYNLVSDMLDNM